MAPLALTAAYFELNSVDMSDDLRNVAIKSEGADLNTTTFGSGGWEEYIGGLKKFEVELEFIQDYAASQVDALLYPLFNTVVPFVYRPTSAAVGTSNPQYAGSVLVKEYVPVEAEVGGLVTVSITLPGSGALTRTTS